MKTRRLSVPLLAALAACTSGAAGWSSEVCGCVDAWDSLAYGLKLREIQNADELTLPIVQTAANAFVGQPLSLRDLPDTGSGDSCNITPNGASCEWKIWERDGTYRGYVADFEVAGTGKITAVAIQSREWAA